MSSGSCHRKRHLGVNFEIWRSERTWFWLVISSRGEGGIIGASANEAQAMRDACISIQEKVGRSLNHTLETANIQSLEDNLRSAHAF
jgi:hypothetical protein